MIKGYEVISLCVHFVGRACFFGVLFARSSRSINLPAIFKATASPNSLFPVSTPTYTSPTPHTLAQHDDEDDDNKQEKVA